VSGGELLTAVPIARWPVATDRQVSSVERDLQTMDERVHGGPVVRDRISSTMRMARLFETRLVTIDWQPGS
jgi:hypothetical protein